MTIKHVGSVDGVSKMLGPIHRDKLDEAKAKLLASMQTEGLEEAKIRASSKGMHLAAGPIVLDVVEDKTGELYVRGSRQFSEYPPDIDKDLVKALLPAFPGLENGEVYEVGDLALFMRLNPGHKST